MAKEKYSAIYGALKKTILNHGYDRTKMLPSEAHPIEEFQCSRNTVRRAIQQLNQEGLVQSINGKGVVVLEQIPDEDKYTFSFNNIMGMREIQKNRGASLSTRVLLFETVPVTEELSRKSGFSIGKEAYRIHRLRLVDGEPVFLDCNYFLCDAVPGLTAEIAQNSVYEYIEQTLGLKILGSRRRLRIEAAASEDIDYLHLDGANCVGALYINGYIDDGSIFEYTKIKYAPNYLSFEEFVKR